MFCSKCGTQLGEESVFCSKCGDKIKDFSEPPKQTKYEISASKFQIIMGSILLILGAVFTHYYGIILGVALFIIGFVSLKTKSKIIKQLISYVSTILFVIVIINLVIQFT